LIIVILRTFTFGIPMPLTFSHPGKPLSNKFLSALPADQFDLLAPHLATVSLPHGVLLYEPGDEVDQVYFPHSGMLSLLTLMRDSKAIGIATIGREGVVGSFAGLKLHNSPARIVVQVPVVASKIASWHFRKVVAANETVRNLCLDYIAELLTQVQVTAACNALHRIESRFCRWLLQVADRSGSETVTVTQSFLAEMLGVRRTSVTEVAGKMQALGIIACSRGVVQLLDRQKLQRLSCQCYVCLGAS
jgi:CRP-like cAMP-binding protein